MVTSTNLPDKKVVKMAEQNNSNNIVVPQRTLLGEVNEHITCPLCRGYYIDATTIVECLHSFCRSCIIKHLQVKSYCPVCEMMINSAKPNIKPDKALQDIVYKLVPGLFQREMERRQHFYASRPGTAAAATPEQRGEDTERIIFSPEDVISFSLEYADATDTDSISSKSSDSSESHSASSTARRYLQCPAVVNISHLKKFISMKYDVDCSQFSIDISYKRVPLPDYYTLMDIAYIYNWKRNEPMRFFFQITDYIAIRTRYGLFDINGKESHFRDIKSSPPHTEDTSTRSPAPNLMEQGFEASSGIDSPISDNTSGTIIENKVELSNSDSIKPSSSSQNINLEEEKSQFLNSFELTAKSNQASLKQTIGKSETEVEKNLPNLNKSPNTVEDKTSDICLKRKPLISDSPEVKKPKLESDDGKPSTIIKKLSDKNTPSSSTVDPNPIKSSIISILNKNPPRDIKMEPSKVQSSHDGMSPKRPVPNAHSITPPNRKLSNAPHNPSQQNQATPKTISPLRITLPKPETLPPSSKEKTKDFFRTTQKKIPDLKPSVPTSKGKLPPIGKLRMDLLANNSDPTIDRSKILSQVKTSMSVVNSTQGSAGDPLKSLFDSCKINIPSSLSITLTDQKSEQQNTNENTDNKGIQNKTSTSSNSSSLQRVPSPPVHNYIEVIKLPDAEPKNKPDNTALTKQVSSPKLPNKPSEGSAKGPVPSLKPIADAKPKAGASGAITFQQSFEQQLQSEKTKLPKSKLQVPKLMPATPKVLNAVNKLNMSKAMAGAADVKTGVTKPDNVLDLSTTHSGQSQIDLQPSKKFEIQSLIKKQTTANNMAGSAFSSSSVRPQSQSASSSPIRPLVAGSNTNTLKVDTLLLNATRQEAALKQNLNKSHSALPGAPSPNHNTPAPNPRVYTRSPSSSPKLVIAEDKHVTNSESNTSQSNQVSSSLTSNPPSNKGDSSNSPTASTKQTPKPMKTTPTLGKPPGSLQSTATPNKPMASASSPADFLSQPQLMSAQHALLRHMEMQNAWLVKAQRQYDLFKNMSNISHHQPQNKDKQ